MATKRNTPKELAGKLREIRARLGLDHEELAHKLQKFEPTVYPGLVLRFEHGKVEPSLLVVLGYARLAGISMESLVDDRMKLPK